jgi:HSP20 family molecular chaperone IbpA
LHDAIPFLGSRSWKAWEPIRALLDPFAGDWPSSTDLTVPKVDITESEDEYHVHAEIPGVSKGGVTAEFKDGMLDIAIKKSPDKKAKQIAVKG